MRRYAESKLSMRYAPQAAALLAILATGTAGSAQTVTMDAPDGVFPEDFSVVQTVRELPDGRVLVADPLGQALVVVDFGQGSADTLGRVGQGPEEYRQPDAVWPMPGGETLLVDLGNGRLTRLGADLSFGDTRPYTVGEFAPGRELVLAIPQAVDAEGHLYFRSMGRPGAGMMADSAWILRLDPTRDAVDSIAPYQLEARTRQSSGGPNNQNVSIRQVPLSPADAWGVAPDGRVVVARVGDYHVEWIGVDGTVTRGPAIEWDEVRIGQAEKEQWANDRATAGGGLSMAVTVQNGSMSMQASRGGDSGGDDLDQYDWPDVKPPFYQGGIPVDPQGRAWIRRHVAAGAAPMYDVFGADGSRVGQVALAEGRRVVGFGDGTVYIVHTDPFGLQSLERHSAPSL